MMERYAANRELLQGKRKRHFRKSQLYSRVKFAKYAPPLLELNKKELEKLKARIRRNKRSELKLWVISTIVVVVSVIWIILINF
jgi:hypothetical protein